MRLPLAAAALLSACAYTPPFRPAYDGYLHSYADEANRQVALVYGYIDMKQGPGPLQRLRVERLEPYSSDPYVYFATTGGMFFHEALPPGRYRLASLEGVPGHGYVGPFVFRPEKSYAAVIPRGPEFRVAKPGVYFLGSFTLKDDFSLSPAPEPSELSVTRDLAQAVQETKWEKPVAKILVGLGDN